MKLHSAKYEFLNVLDIEPTGWSKRQLEIQLEGLTGNLDLFWPDVKDSSWFGGDCEGWERAPYWLDGAIPLAYLLKNEELIKRIKGYIDYIIENQKEDGWLGPKNMNVENVEMIFDSSGKYDLWAQFLILKVLKSYYEITKDKKIIEAIKKCMISIEKSLNYTPLFNWAHARWFEALITIFWYYDLTGEEWVLNLAVKLRGQGFDWAEFFKYLPYKEATEKHDWNYMSHVVNNVMAVKAYALWYRVSGSENDLKNVDRIIETLDKYHGTVVGTVTGDECLAGTSATRGTELCSVVEYMYSLEEIIKNTGLVSYADKLERIAFNALPATISENMWSHQYDQQVNQIECSTNHEWPWNTNQNDANIFGLQPHFGCCTSNMHQGWPKFFSSMWLQDKDENLVAISYAPCNISKKIKNKEIKICIESDYPFKESVKIKIDNSQKANFSIFLRIPNWSKNTQVLQNNNSEIAESNLVEVKIKNALEIIEIKFSVEIEKIDRNKDYFSIKRGALIYSLKIEENWKRINENIVGREEPHADYEIYANSKWNYSFDTKERFEIEYNTLSTTPFSSQNPPVILKVNAKEISNWISEGGCVGELSKNKIWGEEKIIKLQPYGATKLRITEFPKI